VSALGPAAGVACRPWTSARIATNCKRLLAPGAGLGAPTAQPEWRQIVTVFPLVRVGRADVHFPSGRDSLIEGPYMSERQGLIDKRFGR